MNKIKRLPGRHSSTRRTGASRSGGMLILVLVIMGVGFILITSALSITIASRNRFYNDAQRSQARLTVTSAAQSVVDAILVTQEITDARIEAWAAAGETLYLRSAQNFNFNVVEGTDNSVAPAIGADSSSAAGYTKMTFGISGAYITIDFETGIDATGAGSNENLKVYLKKIPVTPIPDMFGAQVFVGGEGADNATHNFRVEGSSDPNASDYAILGGDISFSGGTSGVSFSSAMVYTGKVTSAAGYYFSDDIVFYGDDFYFSAFGGNAFQTTANILFIGEGEQYVFGKDISGNPITWTDSYAGGFDYANMYFRDTTFLTRSGALGDFYPATGSGKHIYTAGSATYIDSYYTNTSNLNYTSFEDGTMVNLSAGATLRHVRGGTNKDIAVTPGYVYPSGNTLPTSIAKFTDPKFVAQATKEFPSTTDAKALVPFSSQSDIINNSTKITSMSTIETLTGSSYYIDVSSSTTLLKNKTFDLSGGDIYLYLIASGSNKTFNIGTGGGPGAAMIEFINGGAHRGYIVLLEGVNINIPVNNWGTKSTVNYGGIKSTSHSGGYCSRGDSGTVPAAFIIGFGANTITARQMSVVDGYVGLFGGNGTFIFDNGPFFYGRIEASKILSNGDPAVVPYCPSPNEGGSSGNTPLATSYKVEFYEYH